MFAKKFVGLALAAVLAAFASTASASVLNVGNTILTLGEAGPSGASIVAGGGPLVSVITTPTYTGTLTSTVYTGDTTNPYGLNALTFVYLLHNDQTGAHDIDRLTISSFSGFSTDVSYQTPAGGVNPTQSTRNSGIGDVIGFTFIGSPLGSGVLSPGSTSSLLVIQTDATVFTSTIASIIDGSVGQVASYAPAPSGGTPTPEPTTLAVAGVGAAAVLFRRRRRTA